MLGKQEKTDIEIKEMDGFQYVPLSEYFKLKDENKDMHSRLMETEKSLAEKDAEIEYEKDYLKKSDNEKIKMLEEIESMHKRMAEHNNNHCSNSFKVNQLNTTIDVLVDKLAVERAERKNYNHDCKCHRRTETSN